MAQPSVLSDKGLARFRTKTCERLLADGICTYRSRCQYSHSAAPPRRNPAKHAYVPELCPHVAAGAEGRGGGCPRGELCLWAHSQDEVNYHPKMYKTRLCQGGGACEDFYCPFAHSSVELREQDPCLPAGHASCSTASSTPTLPAAGAAGDGWWELDDRLSVASEARGATPPAGREPAKSGDRGEALAGGRVVQGLLRARAKGGERVAPAPCRVKMVPAGRAERVQASQVVKELKWWMSLDAVKDNWNSRAACVQGSTQRALILRRTVATACLALPDAVPPTLGECVDRGILSGACGSQKAESIVELCDRGARGPQPACAVLQAGAWARQLAEEVARFHSVGCAHLCISPSTVLALEDGTVRLGDFLGKIRALGFLRPKGGCGDVAPSFVGEDCGWAAWLPAEAQRRAAQQADGSPGAAAPRAAADKPDDAELLRVDLWQLGVVIFFMLTGEHPFGDRRELRAICENIQRGDAVNLGILAGPLPLFADLVARLIADAPERRWSAQQALGHPALWSWDEAWRAVARTPRLLPAALHGGVAQALPALAPFLAGGAAACGGSAVHGAAFEDSAEFLAALGLQPAHAPQEELAPTVDGAAQRCRAAGAVPTATAACREAACEQSTPTAACLWRRLDEQSIGSGSLLRCVWHDGVRYRRGRSRNDRLDRTAYFNVEVFVRERVRGWVRAKHGWLPLYGVGEAEGQPLFELVPATTTSAPRQRADAADAPPAPHRSPRGAQQARPARRLEAPPGLGGDLVAPQVPAPSASEAAFEAPPGLGGGVTAPLPSATTTKEAAFEALLSWAKAGSSSWTPPPEPPTQSVAPPSSELNPYAQSWFPPPRREAAESLREPVKVQVGALQPRAPAPLPSCDAPAYVETGITSHLCSRDLVDFNAYEESCDSLFSIQPLHALLGIAGCAALPAFNGLAPMFAYA